MTPYNRPVMFLSCLLLTTSVKSGWTCVAQTYASPSHLISKEFWETVGILKHVIKKGLSKYLFTKVWAGLRGTKSGEAIVLLWGLKKQVERVISRGSAGRGLRNKYPNLALFPA